MALDGGFLHNLINELNEKLSGARVDKIYEPSREELVLGIRPKNRRQPKVAYLGARRCFTGAYYKPRTRKSGTGANVLYAAKKGYRRRASALGYSAGTGAVGVF